MGCQGLLFKAEVTRGWHNDCITEEKKLRLMNKCLCEECLKTYEAIGEILPTVYMDYIEDGGEYLVYLEKDYDGASFIAVEEM